jgi:hypothetical protein
MATSTFFNNFGASSEQNLLESLIIESIRIYGQDLYYIPRELLNYDKLYGTDDSSRYSDAFLIEMYIKSFDGFLGNKDFISKIAGVDIDDQVKFTMSKSVFEGEIGQEMGFSRPREGDIIYFPLNKKCFQITFVEKYEMFYQLGALYTWEVTCSLFEYSGEKIQTGIPEIDELQTRGTVNVYDYAVHTEDGAAITTEAGEIWVTSDTFLTDIDPLADNDYVGQQANAAIDWANEDPFAEFGKVV